MVRGGSISPSLQARPDEIFYWERQSGGLCRMHALNAFFGAPKLDRVAFEAEIVDYDAKQKARGHTIPSAGEFDTTTCDHKNIISHILGKNGVFARLYDQIDSGRAVKKAEEEGVAFVFSPDHIWLIRLSKDRIWYRIDSLSGISRCDLNEIARNRSLGLIIPARNLQKEFIEIGEELKRLVEPDIIDYLIKQFYAKKVLGGAETLIGAACMLLELQNNGRIGYVKLDELFAWYTMFTRDFHGHNCASIQFILRNVPQIIARILAIWRCALRLDLKLDSNAAET